MNAVNTLFVISTIMVPLLLISLNYESINNFYTISVPMNSFVAEPMDFSNDPNRFQRIKGLEDSTCFVTPANNEYCFKYPIGDEEFRYSHPIRSDEVSGEMHLEPANNATGYWSMSKIVPVSDDSAIITFSDNSDRYPPETLARWLVTEEFEFTRTVEKYETFVSHCAGDGFHMEIMQYLGLFTIEDTDYLATWHVHVTSDQEIACKYPQIIQASFGHDFGL